MIPRQNLAANLAPVKRAPGIIRIHGHRGARGAMPENTLEGFAYTFALGIDIVELDVLATLDGVAVITHNPRLLAASTRDNAGQWQAGEGPRIVDLSLKALQAFDVGGLKPDTHYGNLFPDQAFLYGAQIPTLRAVAELAARPEHAETWLNLEIKSDPRFPENTPPLPEYVAIALEPILRFGLAPRVIIQSFDWRILEEVARQAPYLALSYLSYLPKPNAPLPVTIYEGSPWMNDLSLDAHNGSLPALIKAAGGQVWSPYYSDLTAEDVQEAHRLGLIVNAWTVNATADIDHMIALGVDGLITDFPARAQRRMIAHGLNWRETPDCPIQAEAI